MGKSKESQGAILRTPDSCFARLTNGMLSYRVLTMNHRTISNLKSLQIDCGKSAPEVTEIPTPKKGVGLVVIDGH